MEQPARLHHRHIEGLAVVGHQQVGLVEEIGDRGEERALGAVAREQELADLEGAAVEVAAADEKGDRARAAAQAGRLEVDEDRTRSIGAAIGRERTGDRAQRRVEHAEVTEIVQLAIADRDVAMPAIRFVAPIDHEALAERRLDRATAEDLSNPGRLDRRLRAGMLGFVGQLAQRRVRRPDDGAQP